MLQKVHHTITDGVGGLRLSLALVDFERRPRTAAPPPTTTSRRVTTGPHDTPLA